MDDSPKPGRSRAQRMVPILLGAAAVALAVFFAGRALRSGDDPAGGGGGGGTPETPPTLFRNADPAVAYIGSDACMECHQQEHAAYGHTPHAASFRAPASAPAFPPANFHHEASGTDYAVRQEEGTLRMRASVTLENGETETLEDRAIAYVIGSGVDTQAFAAELDGFLVQAPLSWDVASRQWGITEGYDVPVHAGFTRPMNESCLTCHAGRFEQEGQSVNRVRILEASIGCENCHGPGGLHAEFRRGPDAPPEGSEAADDTIVSLRRASRTQQMDICAQCHMDPYMTVVHAGKQRQDWRPGMPWTDVQTTYRPGKDSIARHDFGGHVDQLRESRCFKESGTLTCITCHGAHDGRTAEDLRAHVNAQCVTCHDACARTAAEGAPPIPAPAADDCATCHMPRREVSELHLASTRHDIAIPRAPGTPERPDLRPLVGRTTLVPLQVAEKLGPAARERNLGVANAMAMGRTEGPVFQQAYAGEAQRAMESARALGLEDAEQEAALALFEYSRRPTDVAAGRLRRALTLDAKTGSLNRETRVRVMSKLVDHTISSRQFEVARGYLEKLIVLRRDAEDWLRMGNLGLADQKPEEVAAAARKALEVLPNEPGVQFQAGKLLGATGHEDEKARCDRIGEFQHKQDAKWRR